MVNLDLEEVKSSPTEHKIAIANIMEVIPHLIKQSRTRMALFIGHAENLKKSQQSFMK